MKNTTFINKLDEKDLKKRTRPKKTDVRGDYYRDQTALIHSLPFRRMKRKTQVFFAPTNDHICTRIEHILHVTTVATTICKGLGLDAELAQAIALGHDLGHPPFGHVGESVINNIQKHRKISFIHEINSYRMVEYIANKGEGLNLCYAVKDGIISHCGEKFEQYIVPKFKIKDLDNIKGLDIVPATYEGCVVRLSDKISYLGRDIEDAMRLGIVSKKNISKDILSVLGVTFDKLKYSVNSLIIDRMIKDAINYSIENKVIGLSKKAHQMMLLIKDFNYKEIYMSVEMKNYAHFVKKVINIIYDELYELLEKYGFDHKKYKDHHISPYRDFARYMESYVEFYKRTNADKDTIITDYIAGMTDDYALNFSEEVTLPRKMF